MSAATPYVWVAGTDRAYIDGDRPGDACVWLDTPAWFAWLEAATTTRFAYPLVAPGKGYISGVLTVRKERRTRGGAYWTAYRREGTRVRKVYLGRTGTITQARLGDRPRLSGERRQPGGGPMSTKGRHSPRRGESGCGSIRAGQTGRRQQPTTGKKKTRS